MSDIDKVVITTADGSVETTLDDMEKAAGLVGKVVRRSIKQGGGMGDLATTAEKLLEVEPDVEEHEFKIVGATGLEGGKDVHVDEQVSISVGGRVTGVAIVVKQRKSGDDSGEMEDYLVRVVTIKATGARIK